MSTPTPRPRPLRSMIPLASRPRQARPPANPWTEAKVAAVLASFRSFASNAATKHGVSAEEVVSLVKDHLIDPD